MTSILIVDDEPLIRRGLESMIPWESLQCQLADQASNGQEGLKKILPASPRYCVYRYPHASHGWAPDD